MHKWNADKIPHDKVTLPSLTSRRGVQSAQDVHPALTFTRSWRTFDPLIGPLSARNKRLDARSDHAPTPVSSGHTSVDHHAVAAAVSEQAVGGWGGISSKLVSAVQLQTWDDGDQKPFEMESNEYGSPLLACEAKLRELQHMVLGVEQPNSMTVIVAFDLLTKVVQTMPSKARRIVKPLMAPLAQCIFMRPPAQSSGYQPPSALKIHSPISQSMSPSMSMSPLARSQSRAHPIEASVTLRPNEDVIESDPAFSPRLKREKRIPHFVLARQQHSTLLQKSLEVEAISVQVDGQLCARSNALSVTYRLQAQSKLMTQHWLLTFWKALLRNKSCKRQRLESLVGSNPIEVVTPAFMMWRLRAARKRLKNVKMQRQLLDVDSRRVANVITRLQIQSEALYSQSIKLQATQATINKTLQTEKQAHGELLEQWQSMHPELLNDLLHQVLGFYFGFMARAAQFTHNETRRQLRHLCFAELLPSAAQTPGTMHSGVCGEALSQADAKVLLINWVNFAIRKVKFAAEQVLAQALPKALAQQENLAQGVEKFLAQQNLPPETNLVTARKQRGPQEEEGVSKLLQEMMPSSAPSKLPAQQVFQERARCEGIVKMEEITNLQEDLHDGGALACLFAVLRAAKFDYELTMDDLSVLDERFPDIRAGQLCLYATGLLSQNIARRLIRAEKITNGTENDLANMLAAIFFSETGLPYTAVVETHSFQLKKAVKKIVPALKMGALKDMKEASKTEEEDNASKNVIKSQSENDSSEVEVAAKDKDGKNETTTNSAVVEKLLDPVDTLMKTMGTCGRPYTDDPLQDPTPLLHGGEGFHDLATIPLEQLLLRWANFQLQGSAFHKPVENFGSDLQDGVAFSILLEKIAPESLQGKRMPDEVEERLEMLVACGQRVTDFELLTVPAILEGHSDVLAAFLCQLFLSRPNLQVRQESLLSFYLDLLDNVLNSGYAALDTREKQSPGEVTGLCVHLENKREGLNMALAAVQDTQAAMITLKERVRGFIGDSLAQRARGLPRSMLDAKESRDFLLYTTLNPERAKQAFFNNTGDDALAIRERVEDVLRKNFRLLREMYQGYSTRENGKGQGITLEGIMKIYQECKLRSRDFAPHHVESIFYEVTDQGNGGAGGDSASPESFVEILLHIAREKFGAAFDSLPEQVVALFEMNLAPHACQDSESFFQKIAYEPKVREVLRKHTDELRMIFRVYAALDVSSAEALSKVSTMNVSEFRMLLEHCDLLDEVLTTEVVNRIFEGIQQSGDSDLAELSTGMAGLDDESHGGHDEGVDDDDELAYSEFLDGLVAIAAYKQPNPFVPFCQRMDTCLVDIFSALRRYWSRQHKSVPVTQMLNALQKCVRGHEEESMTLTSSLSRRSLHASASQSRSTLLMRRSMGTGSKEPTGAGARSMPMKKLQTSRKSGHAAQNRKSVHHGHKYGEEN